MHVIKYDSSMEHSASSFAKKCLSHYVYIEMVSTRPKSCLKVDVDGVINLDKTCLESRTIMAI